MGYIVEAMVKMRIETGVRAAVLAGLVMFAVGCSKPPEKALSDAEKALLAASARRECADDKYLAAEKLLAEAKELVEAKKYDEAESKALAAQKMAEEARVSADANWEECQKRKNKVAEATKPVEKDPEPPKTEELELRVVFFAYDSAELTQSQRRILENNANWMRQNEQTKIVLEGHTDERGSSEYNLALGERRAQTVRQYLIQLGIEREKLSILSYGEEMPDALGASEADFRQNRRVVFVPKKK